MSDPRGVMVVTAGGREYRLHLGMSVLAELQGRHGQDCMARLDPPADAPPNWMPPLALVVDLIQGALQRYHADEADRFLVDDIIAENQGAFNQLMAAAFPSDAGQAGAARGNGKRPRRAA